MVRSDTAVGTPDYISPEVLESQGGTGTGDHGVYGPLFYCMFQQVNLHKMVYPQ